MVFTVLAVTLCVTLMHIHVTTGKDIHIWNVCVHKIVDVSILDVFDE